MQVVQAIGIGCLQAHATRLEAEVFLVHRVGKVPGMVGQVLLTTGKAPFAGLSRASGMHPLGLGRQTEAIAGLGAEPLAVLASTFGRDADDRVVLMSKAAIHQDVRLAGTRVRIHLIRFAFGAIHREHKGVIHVPCGLGRGHPERTRTLR